MEITRLGTRIAALAALAWGSACGGNVVVDGMPDGSGGAGATSASANSSGVTSSSTSWMTTSAVTSSVVTSSATGVGGGDLRSRCEAFCEFFSETCEPVAQGCSSACDDLLGMAPQCNDLLLPFFDCATGDVKVCDVAPTMCKSLLDQYDRCASGDACGALDCSRGGDRTCQCKGSCQGIDFAAECRPGMAGVLCSCLVNGVEVAGCEDRGPACDVALGCCGPIFEEFR